MGPPWRRAGGGWAGHRATWRDGARRRPAWPLRTAVAAVYRRDPAPDPSQRRRPGGHAGRRPRPPPCACAASPCGRRCWPSAPRPATASAAASRGLAQGRRASSPSAPSRSAAPTTRSPALADERAAGVVTHSSGNHAQGVARAARLLGIRAVIVMPTTRRPSRSPACAPTAPRSSSWARDNEERIARADELARAATASRSSPPSTTRASSPARAPLGPGDRGAAGGARRAGRIEPP